jgi:hypothetical protein
MKLLALSVAVVALAGAAKKNGPPAEAPAPNASLARSHGGRLWVTDGPAPAGGEELRAWLAAHGGPAELGRKGKEGPWAATFIAVFKRPAAKGAVTVKFFDKAAPKNLVEESSSDNDAPGFVYQGSYDLDPDHGFNEGHTYLIRVGQIIKGKFQPYASGEVTLR